MDDSKALIDCLGTLPNNWLWMSTNTSRILTIPMSSMTPKSMQKNTSLKYPRDVITHEDQCCIVCSDPFPRRQIHHVTPAATQKEDLLIHTTIND